MPMTKTELIEEALQTLRDLAARLQSPVPLSPIELAQMADSANNSAGNLARVLP